MLPNQQETADLVMFTEETCLFLSIDYLKLCSLNNVLSSLSKFSHHKSNWKLQQIDILIPKQK